LRASNEVPPGHDSENDQPGQDLKSISLPRSAHQSISPWGHVSMSDRKRTSHVLILGTGIAGLSTALKFAKTARVTLVAKSDAAEGSTRWAQGGIATVWTKDDSRSEEHTSELQS